MFVTLSLWGISQEIWCHSMASRLLAWNSCFLMEDVTFFAAPAYHLVEDDVFSFTSHSSVQQPVFSNANNRLQPAPPCYNPLCSPLSMLPLTTLSAMYPPVCICSVMSNNYEGAGSHVHQVFVKALRTPQPIILHPSFLLALSFSINSNCMLSVLRTLLCSICPFTETRRHPSHTNADMTRSDSTFSMVLTKVVCIYQMSSSAPLWP